MAEEEQPKRAIGDKVSIAGGAVRGTVIGLYYDRSGLRYDVEYVTEQLEVRSKWAHPDEIVG